MIYLASGQYFYLLALNYKYTQVRKWKSVFAITEFVCFKLES